MSEFKPVAYRSFAEFFDREFLPGLRPFPAKEHEMGAFAEARYFAWEQSMADQGFPVKGHSLDAFGLQRDAPRRGVAPWWRGNLRDRRATHFPPISVIGERPNNSAGTFAVLGTTAIGR